MNILVTNDDGINARGIAALVSALKEVANVIVMAPLGEQSAVGHALTMTLPLRVSEIQKNGEFLVLLLMAPRQIVSSSRSVLFLTKKVCRNLIWLSVVSITVAILQ